MNETENVTVTEAAAEELPIAPPSAEAEGETMADAYEAPEATSEEGCEEDYVDYSELAARDIEEIHSRFPESRHISTVHSLDNPERYAELRDLGLSAYEAYLATQTPRKMRDNRAHLTGSVPKGASGPAVSLSISELDSMRDVFGALSDSEIQSLYKRVMR